MTAPRCRTTLGYKGDGPAAELILDGQYTNLELDEYTQDLPRHLKRKATTDLPKAEITRESFLGKLKHWPERTTTSSPGIHMGHYKALCAEPLIPTKAVDRKARFDNNQELLISCHLAILNYAIRFGYSFKRWQRW